MKMDQIMEILNKAEFKKDFEMVKKSFFGIFNQNKDIGLTNEENLAFVQGVAVVGGITLYTNLIPIWFKMWESAQK